jgi:hypothetical protein
MLLVKPSWKAMLIVFSVPFSGCAITDQTPNDVSQKFEQGIQGKGHLVPEDANGTPTDTGNSATALPAPGPQ